MKKIFILSVSALLSLSVIAQSSTQTNFRFTKQATVNLMELTDDYSPNLRHLEAPAPGTESAKAYLALQKQKIGDKIYTKTSSIHKRADNPGQPNVLRNFNGNEYKGIPNDNSLAVNNDGQIVSMINSTFQVYDTEGQLVKGVSLKNMGTELNLPGNKFDPRVIYDPTSDRFIMTYLNGNEPSDSRLTVGFSQTSDPTGDWNLYSLPGDPLQDSSWSDYPMISLSDGELFYTINLLVPGGTWQTSFIQTVVWQINKDKGYNGDELESKLWSDINFENKPIRNIHPVKGAKGGYGDNMYLLSNRNFDLENDTIFFMEITSTLDDPNVKLNVDFIISDVKYGLSPSAGQLGARFKLQTNDSRVLDAFYDQDQILFAQNCVNFDNNFSSIYLGHIHDISSDPILNGLIVANDTLEFGYPGLAFTGSDDVFDGILCADHSSIMHYPGCGSFFYDGQGLSEYSILHNGEYYIGVLGSDQRWGDYIGMQPVYNEPGKCWMSGTYSLEAERVGTEYGTWIGEFSKGTPSGMSTTNAATYKSSLFPNPSKTDETITLNFEMPEMAKVNFTIYNLQGQEVHRLFNSIRVKKGSNGITFKNTPLIAGMYILKGYNKDQIFMSQQFIVK